MTAVNYYKNRMRLEVPTEVQHPSLNAEPPNQSLESDAIQQPILQRLRIFSSKPAAVTRRST